jgi:hypothetical protein
MGFPAVFVECCGPTTRVLGAQYSKKKSGSCSTAGIIVDEISAASAANLIVLIGRLREKNVAELDLCVNG